MSIIANSTKTVTTTQTSDIEIDADGIRELLRAAGHEIPDDARIYFAVPGGADWSNTDIDIDKMHPLRVEWSTTNVANK